MTPIFFANASAFRKWLDQNHKKKKECYVGFYKVKSGKKNMSWSESVDEAICYGWIDGRRNSIDTESYMIRFTPRLPGSNWSAVNIKKVAELKNKGLMQPAGLAAYAKIKESKSKVYAFEQKIIILDGEYQRQFKANKKAWTWYQASAPSYQKASTWWVMSAKQKVTQIRRLATLIECSEQGLKIPSMRR